MQGRAIEAGSGTREAAPVTDAIQNAVQQVSPLDGANRGPIVDPSAFILRGTKQVSHTK